MQKVVKIKKLLEGVSNLTSNICLSQYAANAFSGKSRGSAFISYTRKYINVFVSKHKNFFQTNTVQIYANLK